MKGLQAKFQFRKTKGDWLQEGTCPQCGKREAYCSASEPKMVYCSREDKCGWSDSVRNLLPDLFEDWSKRVAPSPENPNATADAYLDHERGLDLRLLRGRYTQELFKDWKTGQTSASIRFPIGDSWWERLIDRPGRFDKKAHFQPRGKWGGHCWMPNGTTYELLAKADEVWITEGIFDCVALTQGAKLCAVSNMSTGPWPEHFLSALAKACLDAGRRDRPVLVFAFDVGKSGVDNSKKHIKRAKREGWEATAAQVRPDGEGTKLDWNDLLLHHRSWRGDPEKAPLAPAAIAEYLYNGKITVAETPREKAKLIVERWPARSSFHFRHANRMFWCRVKLDDEGRQTIDTHEICNCAWRILYREYDRVEDQAQFFLQIDFPFGDETERARFSAAAMTNSAEFKKRLMTFAGSWSGTTEQLDVIAKAQMRKLKKIEPVKVLGYSRKHAAWLLGDIAVHKGRVVEPNAEEYFEFGKLSAKLASPERPLAISYDPDRIATEWLDDLWTAYGARGVVVLSFFIMSLFAVQIRLRQGSLGFLEITGLPGAGKSTLVESLWRLFGRDEYEGLDPAGTTTPGLARELVKVSNLPVGLIESTRDEDKSHGKKFDPNELLVLFNGRSPRTVGRRTGGYETDSQPFQGALYLMQNERISAIPAVLQRLMSLHFDKSHFSDAGLKAAERFKQAPLSDVSGTIIHVTRKEEAWLAHYDKRFAHHFAEIRNRVSGLKEQRIALNHSQLAAGVECLPLLFANTRPEWVAEAIKLVDAMALDREQSIDGDHPVVSAFWENVDWLIGRETDNDKAMGKSLNRHRKPDEFIAINLPDYESRCRNAGLSAPDIDKLKKHLRGSKSRKWLASKAINAIDGKTQQCWVFQIPAAQKGPFV
ncbi:MAG: toprim domain-containing protein [Porphyrobacter sp.]|nr:toprim domain-containing protein [Porphyrobacter sp.]